MSKGRCVITKQDIKKLYDFFLASAKRDIETFVGLKKMKRFDAALFFLHLSIEKHIKALFLKRMETHPPMSHDLVFLIGRCAVDASEQILGDLRVISTFNIQTQYENEKFDFYKAVTPKYVAEWEKKGKVILAWIQEQQKHN